jgi:hypothetical protein
MLAAACAVAALGIGALMARGRPRSAREPRRTAVAPRDPGVPMPVAAPGPPSDRPDSASTLPPYHASAADAAKQPTPLTARDLAIVDEAALMVRLRQLGETDPPLSLRLAREGNARFPNSPDAPERAFIVVKSLVDMTRFKEAQQEARKMLKNYPNDPRTLDVERHLLSNPLD